MKKTLLIMILAVANIAAAGTAKTGKFGLGVIAGEPTGPCFKYWTSHRTAIDGAVAWSFANNSTFHVHADYLIHNFSLIQVEKGRMPFYFGIGGRIRFAEGNRDDNVGIRVPFGVTYMFQDAPVDIFFEIVPILDLTPSTDIDFNGAVGIRYFFGSH